jgi:Tol biopolymer transport system component
MTIKKILVANRSEIAIRVFRAANELGLKTVACYAEEDKLALHRFKADEAYLIGKGKGPVEAYLQIDEYIRVARVSGADAIHPGYGLLSESPEFAEACEDAGIIFIGPRPQTMRDLGNKVAAREMAASVGVPMVPATGALPDDLEEVAKLAADIGYPLMLKASWGGGAVEQGVPCIVSELLEGESLRSRLRSGALPLRKAIEIARHTADGLAAAHDKGIVHRDIKPDNIFITSDGRVKILDFGIAKLNAPEGEARGIGLATETSAGAIVGTAGYMSPELVRGESVDARSDIFSLGSVLYEMVTGRAPFSRDTAADTMAAILDAEPPDLDSAAIPAGIARVAARCLEKTREARYQSARDLAFGLELLSGTNTAAATVRPRRRIQRTGIIAVIAGITIASAGWLLRPRAVPDPLANAIFSRLTGWPGEEGSAQISPDGKFVVFLADRAGEFDIWQGQIGSGTFINLTDRDVQGAPAPNPILAPVGFSADGTQIWVHFGLERDRHLMLMPLGGGPRSQFLGQGVTPAWSPDGRVAYVLGRDGDPMFVSGATGADPQQITADPKHLHSHNPVWSTDGQWIYFVHGREPSSGMDVWRVRADGTSREQITTLGTDAAYIALLDDRTLLFTARAPDLSGPWLWSIDVPTRLIRRAVTGLERYTSVSASRDGRRIVATVANPQPRLWTIPILDRSATEADAKPYPIKAENPFAPRFAGTSLYYLTERGAANGLWRIDDAGEPSQIWNGMHGGLAEPVSVSRDGRRLAIVLRDAGGRRRLVTLAHDGTNARTISGTLDVRGAIGQAAADWSPDGNSIVVGGDDGQGEGLFKIPSEGGTPVRLVTGRANNPVWSPGGQVIVYSTEVSAGRSVLKAVTADGTPAPFPEMRAIPGAYRFTPDGRALVFLPVLTAFNFEVMDLVTGKRRVLTEMSMQGAVSTFDITPDGSAIVFDRAVQKGDIVLIERARPGAGAPGPSQR